MNYLMRVINKEPPPPPPLGSEKMWDRIVQDWLHDVVNGFRTFTTSDSVRRRLIEHAHGLADKMMEAKQYKWIIFFDSETSLDECELIMVYYIANMPIGSNTTEKIKREFIPFAKDLPMLLKRDLHDSQAYH